MASELPASKTVSHDWLKRLYIELVNLATAPNGTTFPSWILNGKEFGELRRISLESPDDTPQPAASNRISILAALEAAQRAMDDWARTYAPEFCDSDGVDESRRRIQQYGTIGYIAHVAGQIRNAIDLMQQDETSEKHRALAREIHARHERVSKLLWGPGSTPGMTLGPMDADEAHKDRGRLLSLLTPEQRGDMRPEEPDARRDCQCATYCMLAVGARITPEPRCRGLPGERPPLKASAAPDASKIVQGFEQYHASKATAPDGWCEICGGRDGEHKQGCVDGDAPL